MSASIADRVRDVLADRLGVDVERVTASARLRDDLNADSLDGVDLAMALEDEFGIEMDDITDVPPAKALVSDVVALVERKVAEKVA
jgi:acyl carrier protein